MTLLVVAYTVPVLTTEKYLSQSKLKKRSASPSSLRTATGRSLLSEAFRFTIRASRCVGCRSHTVRSNPACLNDWKILHWQLLILNCELLISFAKPTTKVVGCEVGVRLPTIKLLKGFHHTLSIKVFAPAKNVDCEIGIFRSDKSFLEGGLGESLFFKRSLRLHHSAFGLPQCRSHSGRSNPACLTDLKILHC